MWLNTQGGWTISLRRSVQAGSIFKPCNSSDYVMIWLFILRPVKSLKLWKMQFTFELAGLSLQNVNIVSDVLVILKLGYECIGLTEVVRQHPLISACWQQLLGPFDREPDLFCWRASTSQQWKAVQLHLVCVWMRRGFIWLGRSVLCVTPRH